MFFSRMLLVIGFLFLFSSVQSRILFSLPETERNVALTFDDGPAETTPKILDILKKHNVKATFFVVGERVSRYPAYLERIVNEGHTLGNHSYNHKDIKKMSMTQALDDLRTTQALLNSYQKTIYFRPPYGSYTKKISNVIEETLGLTTVLWTVDPKDWKNPSPEALSENILSVVKSGDIVLLHDLHPHTVHALPDIILGIQEKGYACVPLGKAIKPLL